MYFKLRKVPYVESLDELLIDDKYNIAVDERHIDFLQDQGVLDEQQAKEMKKRREKYFHDKYLPLKTNSLIIYQDDKIFNDIVEGRAVILDTSLYVEAFAELRKNENEFFVVAKNKYFHRYLTHVLTKTSYLVKQQNYGLVFNLYSYYSFY